MFAELCIFVYAYLFRLLSFEMWFIELGGQISTIYIKGKFTNNYTQGIPEKSSLDIYFLLVLLPTGYSWDKSQHLWANGSYTPRQQVCIPGRSKVKGPKERWRQEGQRAFSAILFWKGHFLNWLHLTPRWPELCLMATLLQFCLRTQVFFS